MRFRRTRSQGPLNIGGLADDDKQSKMPDLSHSDELAWFLQCLKRDRSRPSVDYFRQLLPLVADRLGFPSTRRDTTSGTCRGGVAVFAKSDIWGRAHSLAADVLMWYAD